MGDDRHVSNHIACQIMSRSPKPREKKNVVLVVAQSNNRCCRGGGMTWVYEIRHTPQRGQGRNKPSENNLNNTTYRRYLIRFLQLTHRWVQNVLIMTELFCCICGCMYARFCNCVWLCYLSICLFTLIYSSDSGNCHFCDVYFLPLSRILSCTSSVSSRLQITIHFL